jgi:hypothetical protein
LTANKESPISLQSNIEEGESGVRTGLIAELACPTSFASLPDAESSSRRALGRGGPCTSETHHTRAHRRPSFATGHLRPVIGNCDAQLIPRCDAAHTEEERDDQIYNTIPFIFITGPRQPSPTNPAPGSRISSHEGIEKCHESAGRVPRRVKPRVQPLDSQ